MGRTSDLTESQVAVLKWLSVNGIKQVEIAAQLGICQSAVSKCLRNMGSNRQNCGRKRSTSQRDDRQLARLAKKNRFCSSKRLAGMWKETGVEASDRTAHRRLHEHEQGFRCRIPAVKPLLNGRQRQTTIEAAEVVQREERRKKKDDRRQSNGLQSCFPTSPSLLFLLETKVPECGGKRVNGTQMERNTASSEM